MSSTLQRVGPLKKFLPTYAARLRYTMWNLCSHQLHGHICQVFRWVLTT